MHSSDNTPPPTAAAPVKGISVSVTAQRTFNPIRRIVDRLSAPPNPHKPMINLGLGDPTVHGNLPTHPAVTEAVKEALESGLANGYPPVVGLESARTAIAKRYTTRYGGGGGGLSSRDVVIASGCSGALDLAIGVLAGEGDWILLPQPGFTIYGVLARSKGIQPVPYPLLPSRGWEIDLEAVEAALCKSSNQRCAAWIINNPSNPCGSVYSKEHLEACLKVSQRYRVTIIADEIYEDMVFEGQTFHPMASLNPHPPLLSCGGISKRFLVPGWRVGWVLIHEGSEDQDSMSAVRQGLFDLAGLILGANSLVQHALPAILERTPASFHAQTNRYLEENAGRVVRILNQAPGLRVIQPRGTMYLMVEIQDIRRNFPNIQSDLHFTELLVQEESVLCLPGSIFGMPDYFRIVYSGLSERITEASERIRDFCTRHYRQKTTIIE